MTTATLNMERTYDKIRHDNFQPYPSQRRYCPVLETFTFKGLLYAEEYYQSPDEDSGYQLQPSSHDGWSTPYYQSSQSFPKYLNIVSFSELPKEAQNLEFHRLTIYFDHEMPYNHLL